MIKQEYFLPNTFSPFTLTSSIVAFEGLATLGKAELLKPPFTDKVIASSLKRFVTTFKSSGDFEVLTRSYIKDDSSLDSKQFTLLTHEGYAHEKKAPFNVFYYDGFTSLLLFYGNPKDKIGVTASIEMKRNKVSFDGMNDGEMKPDDIIINQIQGPLSELKIKVNNTFSEFRWEKLLVEIFISWARESGLKKIFLLPSAYNEWSPVKNDHNGTALLRYDTTAKRLGFKRNNKDEPYKLESDKKTQELFDTLLKNYL